MSFHVESISDNKLVSWHVTSDSISDLSVSSNSALKKNVSSLGLCGMDICPKNKFIK